ncbi:M48 family metallopeptidase [Kribbella sp. NBC_01245]|uniref:M48 family metallopeptidase n=1 Tax=Kribbella sp. NBC_01245 TaxID=2903578 RepID=UPI002E2B505D|nr:M48 family metallopeptidase [Kribbella sp. NBC_01245]
METNEAVTHCPQCNKQLRVDPRFVTWCDACEWNVDPLPVDDAYPAWRQKLEHRLADTLYRELEHGTVHKPGWDAARVAAYLLSFLVLLLPLVALAAGIAILVVYRPQWLSIPIAAIAFVIAWALRPRPSCLNPDHHQVSPDEAPRLYSLLDEISTATKARPVVSVVLTAEPELWITAIGWRMRPVVGIGLPLWAAMSPQQRVALLAHEFGHGRNGDMRHSLVVGNAENILDELESSFSPQPYDELKDDYAAYVEDTSGTLITRFVNALVGPPVRAYRWLLTRASLRGDQRAEYLADRLAAEVAGSEAAAFALERLVIADTAYRGLEKALRFGSDVEPLEAVRRAVSDIPAREIDRRIRATRIRETRTDASHPPTYLRVKLIRARPTTTAKVVLGLSDSATIDRELAVAGAPALTELRRSFAR